MTDSSKDRRGGGRGTPGETAQSPAGPGAPARDYNYVLHITGDDLDCLQEHSGLLATGSARFAEIFYDYLFDNPEIARLLYAHERGGGDTSSFIRGELAFMLELFATRGLEGREQRLLDAGRHHVRRGLRPAWLSGAYRLFLEFQRQLTGELGLRPAERARLDTAIVKLVLRDLGLITEGYWQELLETANREIVHANRHYVAAEELLAGLPHLLWSVDPRENRLLYANYPLQQLYSDGPVVPYPFIGDVYPDDEEALLECWQQAVSGDRASAEARISLAGSPLRWYRLSLYPVHGRKGTAGPVHCMLDDMHAVISERERLEKLSTTDVLTRLPNRALWIDHLNRALAASRRVPGSQVAVIALDVNQFKMYNDTLGRDVGDRLLAEIAERLRAVVRQSDSLARLGEDQFGIVLQPDRDARAAAERVVTQVLDHLDLPFNCADRQLCVSATLGISCYPEHGDNENSLLVNAETAMYRAKRNGLPYQFYNPVSDVTPVEQLRYSGQIRGALENDEFELYYQPQVDLRSSTITGAEALLRWQHPREGTVLPQRIIPVAEQLGMISPITDWVLETALHQCRQWNGNGQTIPVSVNVSARSFMSPRLVDRIEQALLAAGVSGELLEIEITEATLMLDLERAREVLDRLGQSGITVAIDDFGTGYSSLSYLKKLPVHTLKIDQSFIMDVAFDNQDIAIVRSIIDLGHNLGYRIVAEGVEHGTALDMLNTLGCDAVQGFHISRPLPDQQFTDWLSRPLSL